MATDATDSVLLVYGAELGPSGEEFETMTEMWPVLEGQHRAELARAEATSRDSSEVPSVDIATRQSY